VPEQKEVKDKQESALLFLWFALAIVVGGAIWLASERFHIAKNQIIEIVLCLGIVVYFAVDLCQISKSIPGKRKTLWPPHNPEIPVLKERIEVETAMAGGAILVGHETDGQPFIWSDEARAWQTIASGMSGAGKSTLIESILQQDIARGVPIIFIDGKGEKKMLDKVMASIAASGRLHHLRLIDPSQPESSCGFNPLYAPHGNIDEHIDFVFESFKVDIGDDFFNQHQRTYLLDIGRVLYYSGKKFNIYDVLVTAYDETVMMRQIANAVEKAKGDSTITPSQRRTLEMAVQNLLSSLSNKDRIQLVQGLLNNLATFMNDALAVITGPYDNLLTIEEVLDKNLILYVSLNVNVNKKAVTSLGRIILQNLQLTLGKRYAKTGYGKDHPFVSVLLDEFAPFAYQNFSVILQTARGANVAFLFALQNYAQLDPAGFGLRDSLSTGPNNTFVLRMKDSKTTEQVRSESSEVKQERISMQVEKAGFFSSQLEDRGIGSRSEYYETAIRDEQLKKLPSGQMQVLMTDQQLGLKHLHIHVRRPIGHFFMGDPDPDPKVLPQYPVNCFYPSMETPMWTLEGLNLRFPTLELEEQRNDSPRRRGRTGKGRK
jgi:hypothetical protein